MVKMVKMVKILKLEVNSYHQRLGYNPNKVNLFPPIPVNKTGCDLNKMGVCLSLISAAGHCKNRITTFIRENVLAIVCYNQSIWILVGKFLLKVLVNSRFDKLYDC